MEGLHITGVMKEAIEVERRARRGSGASDATRERLILEAERLFAEHGIGGVTMRMVCEAAEQKFAGSVQYHFGDAAGLLYALFEYREKQLQPQREALLDEGRSQDLLSDVRFLLRILFEPNFHMYADEGIISYIRVHAGYLVTHRPRGVPHPVDRGSPATVALRETMDLLNRRLSVLGPNLSALRLESVGGMFLHGITEYAADPSRSTLTPWEYYNDLLDMMAAAICVLPRVSSGR
jgi:AcrR family transcriptional regulator